MMNSLSKEQIDTIWGLANDEACRPQDNRRSIHQVFAERLLDEYRARADMRPVAWVRYRSDGGMPEVLLDSSKDMCDVRRNSGAWLPLVHPSVGEPIRALSDEQREKVQDAVRAALGDAYDCTRVWAAWGVGTMSQDDFAMVAEDDSRVAEITDAAIEALTRASAATVAEPGAGEPPLGGRWHHGNGVVVCGTLRIFGEDFDTDPAQDFKESILTWVCDTLNAAQDAYRAAQSGQRAGVAEEVGVLKLNPLTPYGMLVRALRIVANATLAEMAAYVGKSAAHLSAMEFGRKEVSTRDYLDAALFFHSKGITHTDPALDIARTARTGFSAAPAPAAQPQAEGEA